MRKAFLLAAGLLCGAALVGAEPLPIRPLMLGHLPMFDLKVAGGAATGGSSGGASGTGTANTVAKFTGASAIGNSTITDDGTAVIANTASKFLASITGASTTSNFFSVTGTVTAPTSATVRAVDFEITGAGSSANTQVGLNVNMLAGFTGAANSYGVFGGNASAATNSNLGNGVSGNVGVGGQNTGAGASGNYFGVTGLAGNAAAGTAVNVGVAGYAYSTGSNRGIGVYGRGAGTANSANGLFDSGTTPTTIAASLVSNNASVAMPIFVGIDNGAALPTTGPTASFTVLDGAQAQAGNEVLTTGTMTAANQAELRTVTHAYQWTTAMIVALGASLTGDVSVATLPAKTIVKNAYVILNSTCAGTTTLTVAVGRTAAGYIDYIVASNAQSGPNTVYGDSSGERGTNLTGYDLPSYTGTTVVNAHFISTVSNLSAVTTCTGTVILETALAP